MKKTLMLLFTLVFVLPLSACSSGSVSSINTVITKKNYNTWQQLTAQLPVIQANKEGSDQGFTITDSNGKESVIEATVYNLKKMNVKANHAHTQVTVHVDRVLNGDKALQNKTIDLVFDGGVTTTNSWYKNKNQTREANHHIMVEYNKKLPKIGSKIIIEVDPVDSNDESDKLELLRQNKMDLNKTYNWHVLGADYSF
ncbi:MULTISPECIES: hypothetical protein [unclassified Companilactobacillus]|jgi:hypothetical protein|uniref:hypothetical protein n=1 Tax=unclassified Companilactobacillus TaxID=2767904 RepID=UPI002FEF2668